MGSSLRRAFAVVGAVLAVLGAAAYVARLLRGRVAAEPVGGGRASNAGRPLRAIRGGAGEA
jgi:ABC-type arginine/histidine transport system permease subunit